MATVITKEEADAHPNEVLDRAWAGEEIVIEQSGAPKLRLVPVAEALLRKPRVPGSMKGQFTVPESFFDPLPEDELRRWEGYDD